MKTLLMAAMVPVMILNTFGGIISAIWLAMLGDWSTVGLGMAYLVLSVPVISLLLIPGMVVAGLSVGLMTWRKRETFGMLEALISLPAVVWTYSIIAFSCAAVFGLLTARVDGSSLLPYLLWGYAVATGPWTFLAQKEAQAGNDASSTNTFFACLGVVAMMIGTYSNDGALSVYALMSWFLPVALLGLVFHIVIVIYEVGVAQRR